MGKTQSAPISIIDRFAYGERTGFSPIERDSFATVNRGHGRVERRRCWATSAPSVIGYANDRGERGNMSGVAMTESIRWVNGGISFHSRRFISSLPARADRILSASGERWGVENRLHRTPGAPFGEDWSVIGVGRAAENVSTLRRLALNPVKGEKSMKIGAAAKRERAG